MGKVNIEQIVTSKVGDIKRPLQGRDLRLTVGLVAHTVARAAEAEHSRSRTVAAVAGFLGSTIKLRADPLSARGNVLYDPLSLRLRAKYGELPPKLIRDFEGDFMANLAEHVDDKHMRRLAATTMEIVLGDPAITPDTLRQKLAEAQSLTDRAKPLTPAEVYLHDAAISTAHTYTVFYKEHMAATAGMQVHASDPSNMSAATGSQPRQVFNTSEQFQGGQQ